MTNALIVQLAQNQWPECACHWQCERDVWGRRMSRFLSWDLLTLRPQGS